MRWRPCGRVSALSLEPRGWVQITSFLVWSTGLILLAGIAARAYWLTRPGGAGSTLLGIAGLGLFLSGPFVMDPAGMPFDGETWHALAHGILGGSMRDSVSA